MELTTEKKFSKFACSSAAIAGKKLKSESGSKKKNRARNFGNDEVELIMRMAPKIEISSKIKYALNWQISFIKNSKDNISASY